MSQHMKGSKCLKGSPINFYTNQVKSSCLILSNVDDFPVYPAFIWQRTMSAKVFVCPPHTLLPHFPGNKLFLIVGILLLSHQVSISTDSQSSTLLWLRNKSQDGCVTQTVLMRAPRGCWAFLLFTNNVSFRWPTLSPCTEILPKNEVNAEKAVIKEEK